MLLGLTSWSEHQALDLTKKKLSLQEYASKLPIVEIDTFFYGLKNKSVVASWVEATPANFKFVVKTHQCMTLHRPWQDFFTSEKEMYQLFIDSLQPLIETGKLYCLLMQFPPYFECETEHIVYLKRLRKIFKTVPIAIEFRHDSWFDETIRQEMLQFMKEHSFSLVTVDEPQVKGNSIPWYPAVTNPSFGLVRLHGRNQVGWLDKSADWRKLRTLYDYNEDELVGLAKEFYRLSRQTNELAVIFNNNSGGHAASNCLSLKKILKLEFDGLNPEQLPLF